MVAPFGIRRANTLDASFYRVESFIIAEISQEAKTDAHTPAVRVVKSRLVGLEDS